MSFSYPLGFLVLIFIPILIIIYILKNKFTEQTVSSTYIWTLSEKFLKMRRPISRIYGIISLLLQILAVIVIAFSIAHPNISLPNSARDLCFILDGSGSMNISNGENTRYELGKQEIQKLIEDSVEGSTYSLICVTDAPRTIYRDMTSKDRAIELLDSTEPTSLNADCVDAIPYAQSFFDDNRSMLTYLITDKQYETNNINLIYVGTSSDNYALENITYSISNRRLHIEGELASYQGGGNRTISVKVDDEEKATQEIQVLSTERTTFSFSDIEIEEDYKKFSIEIVESDSYVVDNTQIIYNVAIEHGNTVLLISDTPFYLQSIISAINPGIQLTVISPEIYNPSQHFGYGLYIFDSYNPNGLPADGSVWLINLTGSTPNYGFAVQDTVLYGNVGVELDVSTRSNSLTNQLKDGLIGDTFYVTGYQKYGLYNNYTTLLSCEGNPVLFVGNTPAGNREVVIGFDIHNSNLPLTMDYITIMRNLINFSFPSILEEVLYKSGDTISVNVLSGCTSIQVVTPSGSRINLDTSSSIAEYVPTDAGTYEINVSFDGEIRTFNVYVSVPEEESMVNPTLEVATLSLQGELEENYGDGIYQSMVYLFVILGVIFVADWLVYCYEQYKLR